MCNHVSGVLPKAFDSRMAISGLMPDLPFTTLLRAWRVTPSTFAAAVTESPKGSRQSCRTRRPGCTGFFMGIEFSSSLMVVDQFNIKGVVPFKAENDSPIGSDRHGPESFQAALQRVQTIPGAIQTWRAGRGIENREDPFHRLPEVRPYPASVAAFIETFQAAMLEAPNHQGSV